MPSLPLLEELSKRQRLDDIRMENGLACGDIGSSQLPIMACSAAASSHGWRVFKLQILAQRDEDRREPAPSGARPLEVDR